MTDPTADAAKLNERVERALRHLPEIAEILDRDNNRPIVAEEARLATTLISDLIAENPSPQPAPPEGEPDEATIERVAEAIAMAGTSHFGDDTPYAQQNHLVKMMRRYEAKAAIEAYGLAARPKVEDVEVADLCKRLGVAHNTHHFSPNLYLEAADLLERLGADRDEWKQQHENLVSVRQTDIANLAAKIDDLKRELDRRKGDPRTRLHNLCEALQEDLDKSPYTREEWEQVDREIVELQRKLREAESKLAEREAELAKADAVIAWAFEKLEPGQHGIPHGRFESDACVPANTAHYRVIELAKERHAARQQQKD